jgi:hypothetical protein
MSHSNDEAPETTSGTTKKFFSPRFCISIAIGIVDVKALLMLFA